MPQGIYTLLTCYQLTTKRQSSLVEPHQCEKCVMELRIRIRVFKRFDSQLKHLPHHQPNTIFQCQNCKGDAGYLFSSGLFMFRHTLEKNIHIFQVEKEHPNQCSRLPNITRSSRMTNFNNRIHQDIRQRRKRMDSERKYNQSLIKANFTLRSLVLQDFQYHQQSDAVARPCLHSLHHSLEQILPNSSAGYGASLGFLSKVN